MRVRAHISLCNQSYLQYYAAPRTAPDICPFGAILVFAIDRPLSTSRFASRILRNKLLVPLIAERAAGLDLYLD